jgi:hypothetical protein
MFMSKGNKLRQIYCRFLSHFACLAQLRPPSLYDRKGMVSSFFCPQIRARRTRDIRIEPMFGNVPVNTMSTHPLVAVCANPEFNCMSPDGASMYCSPHPAALHIAPAARLREFCF